jgi:hypothetical protein
MAINSLYKDAEVIPIGTMLEMLDAGEMFEGVHGFNVKTLLNKIGLTGSEMRSQVAARFGPVRQPAGDLTPGTNNIQNGIEPSAFAMIEREPTEASAEVSEV